jgi:hypothetical protein
MWSTLGHTCVIYSNAEFSTATSIQTNLSEFTVSTVVKLCAQSVTWTEHIAFTGVLRLNELLQSLSTSLNVTDRKLPSDIDIALTMQKNLTEKGMN